MLILCGLDTARGENAIIKCWTDDSGVRACGDRVPPEDSAKEQTLLNQSGVEVGRSERTTPLEDYLRVERDRRELLDRERAGKLHRKRDEYLKRLYSNVQEIILERDQKLSTIEGRLQLSMKTLETLGTQKDTYLQELETARLAEATEETRQQTNRLLEYLLTIEERIAKQHRYVEEKHAEIQAIRTSYEQDIERFKEIQAEAASAKAGTESPAP